MLRFRTPPSLIAILLALGILGLTSAGARADSDTEGIEIQLRRLNANVAEVSRQLARMVDQQEASLFIRRLELASQRVDQAEDRLENLRAQEAELERRLTTYKSIREKLELNRDDVEPEKQERLEADIAQVVAEGKNFEDELARTVNKAIEADNELRRRRDELTDLQESLDDAIERLLRVSEKRSR